MTVCGYNDGMGAGIRILCEGFYDAVDEKARLENKAFADILTREVIEIPNVNASLSRSEEYRAVMFRGLNAFALPLFREALSSCVEGSIAKPAFMELVDRFVACLAETESHNRSVRMVADEDAIAARARHIGDWALEWLEGTHEPAQ